MQPDPADASVELERERQPWALLVLLCVAQFMVIIDISVVNIALPSIGRTLDFASPADLQWVVTAYVLFSGGLTLLGGRMSDLLGARRMFLAGLLLFTAASMASGLAPSPVALIASRAAQGLGAALLTPAALSTITTTYQGRRQATGLAVWGAIGAAGAAAGVLLGGLLTSWLGWQWVFFVNVPVGAASAALALRLVPSRPAIIRSLRELDLGGPAALIAGLFLLVYTIEGVATFGWGSSRTVVSLVVSAGLLAAFAAAERSVAWPLVPPSIWRVRSVASGVVVMLGAAAVLGGFFFLSSLYLQRVLQASALEAGLAFLPFAVVVAVAAYLGSRLIGLLGARSVLVGGLVVATGGALFLARMPDQASYFVDVLPGFLTLGAGIGAVFMAVSIAVMGDVAEDLSGLASGMLTTGHEIGVALGVAVFSAVAVSALGGAGFSSGYGAGLLAAAIVAGATTLLSVLAVPRLRPSPGTRTDPQGG